MNSSIDIRNIRKKDRLLKQKKAQSEKNISIQNVLNYDIKLFGDGLADKTKEEFYLEISRLMEAGVDISTVLDLIKNEQPKKSNKEIFERLNNYVVSGSTLSMAMIKCKCFTSYEYFSVQIGEETGKLILILKDLATYYQKKIKQRRQIITALTYPIIVLTVAFGAVSFMLAFVVPMFSDVLKRFGGDLPFITKIVLHLSIVVKEFIWIILFFIGGIATFIATQKRQLWFRKMGSKILLKIPLVGNMIRKIYLSRFANTMSLLLSSKIPLVQSLKMVGQMIKFFPIEDSLKEVEENILSGMPLYKSLSFHSFYPRKMISLIKVGEEVNQLESFFNTIFEQFSNEVEYQTNMLSKFLEPFIIIFLGIVVGVILIAMYLPLFKMGQAF